MQAECHLEGSPDACGEWSVGPLVVAGLLSLTPVLTSKRPQFSREKLDMKSTEWKVASYRRQRMPYHTCSSISKVKELDLVHSCSQMPMFYPWCLWAPGSSLSTVANPTTVLYVPFYVLSLPPCGHPHPHRYMVQWPALFSLSPHAHMCLEKYLVPLPF